MIACDKCGKKQTEVTVHRFAYKEIYIDICKECYYDLKGEL